MSDLLEWQSRVRLVDEVAQVLRERIYRGQYAPGDLLRQTALAQDLGVSRTPLREALRVLQHEGLVELDALRGASVARVDRARLLDAYALREMLDGLAARLAAEQSANQAHARLDPLLARERLALQPWAAGDYTLANVALHATIVEMAHNQFLDGQLGILRMTSQIFAAAAEQAEARARTAAQAHEQLIEAIAQGDGEAAERVARAHIRATLIGLRNSPADAGARARP
jgi:DNA-binding GntR family transcriptional regulator